MIEVLSAGGLFALFLLWLLIGLVSLVLVVQGPTDWEDATDLSLWACALILFLLAAHQLIKIVRVPT